VFFSLGSDDGPEKRTEEYFVIYLQNIDFGLIIELFVKHD